MYSIKYNGNCKCSTKNKGNCMPITENRGNSMCSAEIMSNGMYSTENRDNWFASTANKGNFITITKITAIACPVPKIMVNSCPVPKIPVIENVKSFQLWACSKPQSLKKDRRWSRRRWFLGSIFGFLGVHVAKAQEAWGVKAQIYIVFLPCQVQYKKLG